MTTQEIVDKLALQVPLSDEQKDAMAKVIDLIHREGYVEALNYCKLHAASRSILAEAALIRSGERNADYGDAVENFRRITQIANAITGLELTPAQCCKVMIAVKLARELHNHKRDNLVDLCGYADILALIEDNKA